MIAKRFQKVFVRRPFFLLFPPFARAKNSIWSKRFYKKSGFLFKVHIALTFARQKPIMLL